MDMQELPRSVFINSTPHVWLEPTAFLQFKTVMQQLCRISFYAFQLLFHQEHVATGAFAAFVLSLAAIHCIRVLLLTKLIELFHGIYLAGVIRQIHFPRLGTIRSTGHLPALLISATLLLRVSLPLAVFTIVTVAAGC